MMVSRIQCVICRFWNQIIRGKYFRFGWNTRNQLYKIFISIHSQQSLFYFSKLSKAEISEFKLQRGSTLSLIKAWEREVNRAVMAQPSNQWPSRKECGKEIKCSWLYKVIFFDDSWTLEHTPRHCCPPGTTLLQRVLTFLNSQHTAMSCRRRRPNAPSRLGARKRLGANLLSARVCGRYFLGEILR